MHVSKNKNILIFYIYANHLLIRELIICIKCTDIIVVELYQDHSKYLQL